MRRQAFLCYLWVLKLVDPNLLAERVDDDGTPDVGSWWACRTSQALLTFQTLGAYRSQATSGTHYPNSFTAR